MVVSRSPHLAFGWVRSGDPADHRLAGDGRFPIDSKRRHQVATCVFVIGTRPTPVISVNSDAIVFLTLASLPVSKPGPIAGSGKLRRPRCSIGERLRVTRPLYCCIGFPCHCGGGLVTTHFFAVVVDVEPSADAPRPAEGVVNGC